MAITLLHKFGEIVIDERLKTAIIGVGGGCTHDVSKNIFDCIFSGKINGEKRTAANFARSLEQGVYFTLTDPQACGYHVVSEGPIEVNGEGVSEKRFLQFGDKITIPVINSFYVFEVEYD